MMKIVNTFIALSVVCSSLGQAYFSPVLMNENNTAVSVNSGGTFFTNPASATPGYEVPKGSENHVMYANSFWFGGRDLSGQLRLSGQLYDLGKDLFKGPANATLVGMDPNILEDWPYCVWYIQKEDIDYHRDHYLDAGYTLHPTIEEWPAHGHVEDGEAYNLAPFIDLNGNNEYEPELGDFPDIRGDFCTYIIMNDMAGLHMQSYAQSIGIEVHFMFYQYLDAELTNVNFANVRVFNRGLRTIPEFYVGSFMDFDLGDPTDDYVGCDSVSGLTYVYNGSDMDSDYGANPPAFGVVPLSHELNAFVSMVDEFGFANWSVPMGDVDFFDFLQGRGHAGDYMIHAGSSGGYPTRYHYNGFPDSTGHWSENNLSNVPGDRRTSLSLNPVLLEPGDEYCFDFAYIFHGGEESRFANVRGLYEDAAMVQEWYDNQWRFNCEQVTFLDHNLNLSEEVKVYPNPAINHIVIEGIQNANYTLYSMDGKVVIKGIIADSKQHVIYLPNTPGLYLLEVEKEGQKNFFKIEKQ